MARNTKSRSKSPTGTAATKAAGDAQTHAAGVIDDAAATPPGMSVPGGANTPASESSTAAGSASGEIMRIPEPSQGNAASGAGNPADPAGRLAEVAGHVPSYSGGGLVPGEPAAPVSFGIDLAHRSDLGVISWGNTFAARSDTHPHTYAFFAALLDAEPHAVPAALLVTAKTNGFRRGGVVHSAQGITFLPGDYTAEQLEAWLGETELTVEIV